ncbi:hypothetical protein ACFZDK_03395 [Streptomyces sp. NPDC007901]|uniref:hypothetical protein n=1 Tax=Streptomyces sp. NPDC007901 TaxID=3364785 RepID=UPI0036EB75DC
MPALDRVAAGRSPIAVSEAGGVSRQPVLVAVTHSVAFGGARCDDVCAAVVWVVDAAESAVGDDHSTEYVVCHFAEDAVDRAWSPGAAVGVEVCAAVELGVGIVVVRERCPSGALGVHLVPLWGEFRDRSVAVGSAQFMGDRRALRELALPQC